MTLNNIGTNYRRMGVLDEAKQTGASPAGKGLFIMTDTMDGLVILSELLVDKEVRSVQYLPKGVALRLFSHRKRIM